MQYTKIPEDTFEQIQMNAGIIVDTFAPSTATIGNILGASTGGITFSASPTYSDYGDDIDNCPKNTMELKKLDDVEVHLSGTFVTVTAAVAKQLAASADIDTTDTTHVVPRRDLSSGDFDDVWWIGDYSDKNTGTTAGYVAIHLMNALNTGGFQIKSTDKAKGQFAFDFMGHYSIEEPDTVPYEIYVKTGTTPTPPTPPGDGKDGNEEGQ